MSQLLISIGMDEAAAYDDLETSMAIWNRIKEMYESGGPARKALLLKKLTLTRMQEGEDVKKHTTEFGETVKRLKEVGLEIVNEMLVILLLNSLPDEYEVFRTTIETQKDFPTFDQVKVKILEFHEGHCSKPENGQGALYARNNKSKGKLRKNGGKQWKNNAQSFKPKNEIECYKCHRKGHIAKYCDQSKNIQSTQNTEDKGGKSKTEYNR